jgi:hypothetical protein
VRYRDKTAIQVEKQHAQWEIDCFTFDILGKSMFAQVYSATLEPSVNAFPNMNGIRMEAIEYFKQRLGNSSNPLLKSRYAHLLWKCPNAIKNNKYAFLAIENYLEAIEGYVTKFNSENQENTSLKIGQLYETLIAVANEVKIKPERIKKLTHELLFNSAFDFYFKHGILEDMLKYPKLFKPLDFGNTLSIFEDALKSKNWRNDNFLNINLHILTAIKIAIKTNSDVKKWHNELGHAHSRIADLETQEDRFWIKLVHYSNAIKAFGLAGNNEKKYESELLYSELKPKVKMPTVSVDLDEESQNKMKDLYDCLEKLAKKILKQDPEEIYGIISNGFLFPKYSDTVKSQKNKQNDFFGDVTKIYFDDNKNISKESKGSEPEQKIYDNYSYRINLVVLPYLRFILIPGIESGKLSFENFIEFVATKSWIGKPYVKFNLDGTEKTINWMGLLIPSIVEFFIQIQGWVSSKYYNPSFVLCVDSLTLKFEGLLRDFCERLKVPTSVSKPNGMQEAYIHNLLDNETIKKFFNEDDLLLFNYLFSNDKGLNLRNNVAHCFYNYEGYNLNQMLLLIAALLRLAKYDYQDKTNTHNI